MKELLLTLSDEEKPLYLRIADAIRSAIREGQAKPKESLPSTRTLAQLVGAHRHTVMAALEELVAEGWLVASHRRGYWVSETLPTEFFQSAETAESLGTGGGREWRFARSVEEDLFAAPPDDDLRYRFQSGLCDLRLFPEREFRSCVADSLRHSGPTVLDYDDPAGHPGFVRQLEEYLRRVRALSGRRVVVTHGSQEGIFIAAQLLVAPGDAVVVERSGYQPAWEALRVAGARLVPVPVDEDGLDPDALERVLRRRAVRLIYTTPLHQYPTTVTMPVPRRMRLYELAAQYGTPILEDDYDHEFHYRCQPLPPLATDDPEGLILYVSTLSKVLFPSARLGFMAVPGSIADAITRYRRIITRQNEGLLQDAVARWMKEGGFERHLRRMRRLYEERRNVLVASLEEARDGGLPISWRTPDGGMALWLDTGVDSDRVASAARSLGVYAVPESAYSIDHAPGTHLRLGFASMAPEELCGGIALVFRAIRECL